jgi:hypothetical protein
MNVQIVSDSDRQAANPASRSGNREPGLPARAGRERPAPAGPAPEGPATAGQGSLRSHPTQVGIDFSLTHGFRVQVDRWRSSESPGPEHTCRVGTPWHTLKFTYPVTTVPRQATQHIFYKSKNSDKPGGFMYGPSVHTPRSIGTVGSQGTCFLIAV